jgi:apolipoprotein N-acyltransferase
VALEMVRARLLSGFPWNFLGVSQYRILPLLQMASMTGVYGLSFLVAWFSVALFCAALAMLTRLAGTPRSWAVELSVPLLVLVTVASLGMHQILEAPAAVGRGVPAEPSTSGTLESAAQPEASPHPDTLNVALVQPSIPQTMIWNSTEASNRFQQLLQLSERALAAKPDLLVWPEAAVPNLFRYDTNIHRAVTNFVRAHRVWLVLGADDAEGHPGARDESEVDYYNSSFLITPEGEVAATYRKQRLVIFGEYVPLGRWLPFLKDFTGVQGDFTPGKGPVTFNLPKLHVKTSVLICFEDVFPHLTRAYVEDDTDFLLNLTNNGWFGESAAQWQHAANAVFRAVENGLPLVRAANNGLTCWVDAQGRLREIYFAGTQDIYGAGFEIVHVPVLTGQTREPTFYRRHGDWFGWGCVGLGAIVVVVHSARERRGGRSTRITTPRLVGSRLKAV